MSINLDKITKILEVIKKKKELIKILMMNFKDFKLIEIIDIEYILDYFYLNKNLFFKILNFFEYFNHLNYHK
jgi:hypothetical protein